MSCRPRVASCLALAHQNARVCEVNGVDSSTTDHHAHQVAREQRVPRLLALSRAQHASDFAPQCHEEPRLSGLKLHFQPTKREGGEVLEVLSSVPRRWCGVEVRVLSAVPFFEEEHL